MFIESNNSRFVVFKSREVTPPRTEERRSKHYYEEEEEEDNDNESLHLSQ
jgi:hypothetical protein